MIGPWDNTNVKEAWVFNAWSKGNGIVDRFIGEMPGHPNGNSDATFLNFAVGEGYLFNNGDGHCDFPGADEHLTTTLNVPLSNTSKSTYEIKFKYNATGNSQTLMSQVDDVNNRMALLILSDDRLDFTIFVGGTEDRAITTTTLVDGRDYTLAFIKDGGTLKIKVNGVEALYSEPNTYALGNKTYTNNIVIGLREVIPGFPFAGLMYSGVFYDDAISDSRSTTNAALGNDYGLIGTNVGDVMTLTAQPEEVLNNGLFLLARNHLVDTVKKVSPEIQISFRVDTGGGARRVDIFTLPGRNRIRYDLDHSDRRVFRWRDPLDLNVFLNPKVKTRRKVANKEMLFRVVFNHHKPSEAENDFDSFMRKLGRTIHDGQTATYLDVDGITTINDTKGNVIHIEPQTFDMNDNKFYGNQVDKIPVDILFKAGIFEADVEDGFLLDGDKVKVLQTAT